VFTLARMLIALYTCWLYIQLRVAEAALELVEECEGRLEPPARANGHRPKMVPTRRFLVE
jgi:hypothetical protein